MRLNTRGRYGIQLMAQLACHASSKEPLGLKQVAAATGLPWRYLEQIARPLRAAALVKGRAGRTGGYTLSRAPERISLRDVIDATAGPLSLMACVDEPDSCAHSDECTSRHVWQAITADIREVLARYSICDLAKRPCEGCRSEVDTARVIRTGNRRKPKVQPETTLSAAAIRRASAGADTGVPPVRKKTRVGRSRRMAG